MRQHEEESVAVRIRLRRIGKKKQPQYRLVAAEAAGPRDGRFIEILGHYDPRREPRAVSVKEERALWWLQHGAQPSDTARSILVETGVWEKFTGEAPQARGAPAKDEAGAEASAPSEEAEEAASAEESGGGEEAKEAAGVEVAPSEEAEEAAGAEATPTEEAEQGAGEAGDEAS